VFKFGIKEYFNNEIEKVIEATNFSRQQITAWINGERQPQKSTVEWLMHCAFAPEFMVITEYLPIQTAGAEQTVRKQLYEAMKNHKKSSGIYAFYDSMANLVYIGKSDGNLFEECCTQLKAEIKAKKIS
jgi:hypothetical protein